jgi:hypothetical protein
VKLNPVVEIKAIQWSFALFIHSLALTTLILIGKLRHPGARPMELHVATIVNNNNIIFHHLRSSLNTTTP